MGNVESSRYASIGTGEYSTASHSSSESKSSKDASNAAASSAPSLSATDRTPLLRRPSTEPPHSHQNQSQSRPSSPPPAPSSSSSASSSTTSTTTLGAPTASASLSATTKSPRGSYSTSTPNHMSGDNKRKEKLSPSSSSSSSSSSLSSAATSSSSSSSAAAATTNKWDLSALKIGQSSANLQRVAPVFSTSMPLSTILSSSSSSSSRISASNNSVAASSSSSFASAVQDSDANNFDAENVDDWLAKLHFASAHGSAFIIHDILPTDTLTHIALLYDVDVELIKQENRIWHADAVAIRKTLKIPIGSREDFVRRTRGRAHQIVEQRRLREMESQINPPAMTTAFSRRRTNPRAFDNDDDNDDDDDDPDNDVDDKGFATEKINSGILLSFTDDALPSGRLPTVLPLVPAGVGHAGMQVAAHVPASAQRRFAKIDEDLLGEL